MLENKLGLINSALEEKSWYYQESFLESDLCQRISNLYINSASPESFIEAKVGKGNKKKQNTDIRKSSIKWIEYGGVDPSLKILEAAFLEIMLSVNQYFHLSLKRFESQFAIYNKGGFYKTHLDQHRITKHRQISCCLYLNDCLDGGELVLYKKGSKTEVDKVITPLKGSLVLFLSADIYHEVKLVNDSRYSITTWFRDDLIMPFI